MAQRSRQLLSVLDEVEQRVHDIDIAIMVRGNPFRLDESAELVAGRADRAKEVSVEVKLH